MHLFDQDNQRWVRFRQSEGTVQPEAWVAADEQDGDWQSITLPTQGLLLWDETEKASAVYFIEAGELHRVSYCEDGQYHAALNIAAMAHKKADAQRTIQERGGQCHEIQGVLLAFLPAVESFSNGEWGLAANIALAQRVTHTAPQIRAKVDPDKLPARPDKDNWLIQRQAPPHSSSTVFKETLDASLQPYAWRIEQPIYRWLLNLKHDSPSRDDYLTALQALILGKQTSSNDGLNAHWPSIIRIRQFIAGLNSEYFHEEWHDANTISLKEYALHCMAAEYQQVAGVKKLPFDYSKDNIPEPEAAVTVSDPTMQEALQLYNAYINDTLTLKQTSEFYRHLNTPRTNRPIKSPYAYLVRWLRLHDEADEKAVKYKLRRDTLLLITKYDLFSNAECEEVATCEHRKNLSEKLQFWYDKLEILLDEKQALALLEPGQVETLDKLMISQHFIFILEAHEAFALALLQPENTEARQKLYDWQIEETAKQHKAFALGLLKPENTEAFNKLDPQQILLIAKRYEAFALALLKPEHAAILENLDSPEITWILDQHEPFALALLKPESAKTLKRLCSQQIAEIATKYEAFALALLKPENAEALKKLASWEITGIAQEYNSFALRLLLNHRDHLIAVGGLNLVGTIQNNLEASSQWKEYATPVRERINELNDGKDSWSGGAEQATQIETALYRAMKHFDGQTTALTKDDFLDYQEGEESSIRITMKTPRCSTASCSSQTFFGRSKKAATRSETNRITRTAR